MGQEVQNTDADHIIFTCIIIITIMIHRFSPFRLCLLVLLGPDHNRPDGGIENLLSRMHVIALHSLANEGGQHLNKGIYLLCRELVS